MMIAPSRGLKACIVAAVAIVGAIVLHYIEAQRAGQALNIPSLLGAAIIPFIVGVLPATFIRGWLGVFIGVLLICVMNFFVAQGMAAR